MQFKKRILSLVLAATLIFSLPVMGLSTTAAPETNNGNLYTMEYLSRGLVAAEVPGGMFLSWRLLGDEPDGISFNVYRDGALIATIEPRDVEPESNYATNPGIVKENTTPTNYTDAAGVLTSVYTVAPVINGQEGELQGLSVPVLSSLGTDSNANKGAVHYIPMKPAPAAVPLPRWSYRGYITGTGGGISNTSTTIPGVGGNWYVVDMDLLRSFREPYEAGTVVEQSVIDAAVAKLNEYNTTANFLGNKTYETATYAPANALVDGKITKALYDELEAEFIKYVENLDSGLSLPYAISSGAVATTNSNAYATHDMSVGDFDGDGEYEIVVKWRSSSPDPMYSEPIYSGNNMTAAPEYFDVYKLDGTLLFRVDGGYNYTSSNDHESPILVGDFDGDGKSELMLKTGLGARIGNWDEATQSVVYANTADSVVGGELGLNAITEKIKEYFTTGNVEALNTYWAVLSNFTISYRDPISSSSTGNDGPNDPAVKRWIKTYHVGRMGPAVDDNEFMSAFKFDTDLGKGVLVDSAKYPFPFRASVDGETWAMTPNTQRGNFAYLAHPSEAIGDGGAAAYKAQVMQAKESYWLENPWKAAVWGDAQGNRANRYTGAVAYLDGKSWYAVSNRGYYQRTTFSAFNIIDGKVNLQAVFDSDNPEYQVLGGEAYDYRNRGNHALDSADLTGDGRDEIVMAAMVLSLNATNDKILPIAISGDIVPTLATQPTQPDGTFLFATDEVRNNPLNVWAPLRHGDRNALLPRGADNKIVQWSGSEEHIYDDIRTGYNNGWMFGVEAHDPLEGRKLDAAGNVIFTNALIYSVYAGSDDEGSVAGNYSNRFPGAQGGSSRSERAVRSLLTGEVVGASNTDRGIAQGQNAIWFDGDLVHEGVNGANINKLNDNTFAATSYLQTGLTSTGQKGTPTLKADLLGDWREEVILRSGSGNSSRIAIVTTLAPTEYGIRTLMHDPMYRVGVANKNAGYDQVGFASFYLGDEAPLPAMRTDILIYGSPTISLSGNGAVNPGDNAEFVVSVSNMSKLSTATLWFEVDDEFFVGNAAEGLNGFDALSGLTWTDNGDGTWSGRITLYNLGGADAADKLDIFKLSLKAKNALGTSTVKLTRYVLSGYDADNKAVWIDAVAAQDSASVNVVQWYSIYDVNRDGSIDQLDVTTAQLYYAADSTDADWDISKIADVNGDGCVDIADFILILNNIEW